MTKIRIPKTPRFYKQSKIHKEENARRSVVSSVNSHTSKISESFYFHLQPKVKPMPSFVKNINDFLRKLDAVKAVPDNTYLVSPFVEFLYAGISNVEVIKSVKEPFHRHTGKNVTITFLALILT